MPCCPTALLPYPTADLFTLGFGHEWPLFTTSDFHFTAALGGEAIFLYLMKWAPGMAYSVQSLNTTSLASPPTATITNITLMGSTISIAWSQDDRAGLHAGPIPTVPQPECPVGLRVHLGGASTAAIDEPTRTL